MPDAGDVPRVVDAVDEVREFEELLMSYALDGLRLARFLGRGPNDAGDVVQEASILAWRYRKTRRGEWKPWFLSIVRRVARRRQDAWTLLPWSWRPAASQDQTEWFGRSDIAMAMARLPRRQRAAVWLRYGQDLTYGDVGRILGVREAAAKMLVSRARTTLRKWLASPGQRTDA